MEPQLVSAMTASVSHRGPDGDGSWIHDNVGFGHRRLAIRDLSPAGRQPMTDPTGRVTITYNGELYNDRILRRALEKDFGMQFRSTCDAETIPAGYAAWGDRIFDRLEGMFAVGMWDAEREELILARDAAGIKPLYVWCSAEWVAFASEVKALLRIPFISRQIDPEALHAFFAQGYVSPAKSLLRGIEQVPPGTVRVIGRKNSGERQFWRPTRQPVRTDLREASDEFLNLWGTVVRDMLVSDVPVGVLQSGGVDSSLIAAELGHSGEHTPLFTGAFPGRTHDESGVAQSVARACGLPHHAFAIEEHEAESTFRAVVHHTDGQLADSSAYAVFQLARGVRRHVPVVLGGDGADEYFGGYPTYRATRVATVLRHLIPHGAASSLGRRALALTAQDESRLPTMEVIGRFLIGVGAHSASVHPQWRRLLFGHHIAGLYGPAMNGVREKDPLALYAHAVERERGSLVDRCLLADQAFYLPADMLMKVDSMSMAHGLEVRVPFLDRRIMDFASSLDSRLLTPLRGADKRVLRDALNRRLPGVLIPKKKRGFNTPVAALLRTGLAPLAGRLLDAEVERLTPLLQPEGVRQLWAAHRDGAANHGYALWCLLTLAVWLESLEQSTQTTPALSLAVS